MKTIRAIAILAILAMAYTIVFRMELDKGICLNEAQDGWIDNGDPYYNYISYRCTDAEPGDKVISLFILNPLNNYCDDYIYRADWIYERR